MATGKRLSEFTEYVATIQGDEIVGIAKGGATYKLPLKQLIGLLPTLAIAANDDMVMIYDTSAGAILQITRENLIGVSFTAFGKSLAESADASAARTLLALGTMATQNANNVAITGGSVTGITDLAIADGGTGQSSKTAAFDALSPTTTKGDLIVSNGSDNVRLAIGTDSYVLTADSAEVTGIKWAAAGGSGAPDYILLKQTATATLTSGAWRTRPLDTEVYDAGGHCTLSSNQFTLAAGTYIISWFALAYYFATSHQTRIYNISDSTQVSGGSPGYSAPAYDIINSQSQGSYIFTIASAKTFELQHQSSDTQVGNGMGVGAAFAGAGSDIFAQVELWKIA